MKFSNRFQTIYVHYIKRVLDFFLSFIFIGLTFPLWVLASILIFMESGGPIFYRQKRVGKDRKEFEVMKFRTMVSEADKLGPGTTLENDSRVLICGRFLRKYRIDELPQFINVLRGEMSLVGPRAESISMVERYLTNLDKFDVRFNVKPGITGLSQVTIGYTYNEDGYKKKLELDLFYVKNVSPSLDLKILLKTALIVLRGRNNH